MERFNLNKKISPVAFLSVNGKLPIQIPLASLDNADALLKWATDNSQIKYYEFKDTVQLKKKCYSKKMCVVIVNNGEIDTLQKAVCLVYNIYVYYIFFAIVLWI